MGVVARVEGGHAAASSSGSEPLSLMTAVFGMRYTVAFHSGRYVVFGEGLAGETNAFHSLFSAGSGPVGSPNAGTTTSANAFAVETGGGLDIRLSRRFCGSRHQSQLPPHPAPQDFDERPEQPQPRRGDRLPAGKIKKPDLAEAPGGTQVSLALILVDADHFKLYNDTYGHQAGDQALQRLAIQLSHCAMRPLDMASRIGGEEMALILYDATADYVHEVCSKLLHDINNLNIPHCAFPTGPCPLSCTLPFTAEVWVT